MVFLTALGIFVAVTGVLCYGIGKVINARMNQEDGPNSKWTKTVDVRQLGNLPSSPEMQNKVARVDADSFQRRGCRPTTATRMWPICTRAKICCSTTTRWVDQSQGKVRIPIERAMELIAQQGLPVAPAVTNAAADDRRQQAGDHCAADQWICAHRL